MSEPEPLAQQALLMESYGEHCVTASGGAMSMDEYAARLWAYDRVLKPETLRGVYAHHDLSLDVANCIVAVQNGAVPVDASLAWTGASAGNAPLEVFTADADGCDPYALGAAIRPPAALRRACGTRDRASPAARSTPATARAAGTGRRGSRLSHPSARPMRTA